MMARLVSHPTTIICLNFDHHHADNHSGRSRFSGTWSLANLLSLGFLIFMSIQLLFAIVVLGLSVTLAKGQRYGSVPAATGYAAFTGGTAIVAALVGCAALYREALNGIISWTTDALASLALLAGGIVRQRP
jgi:hypothetical protein